MLPQSLLGSLGFLSMSCPGFLMWHLTRNSALSWTITGISRLALLHTGEQNHVWFCNISAWAEVSPGCVPRMWRGCRLNGDGLCLGWVGLRNVPKETMIEKGEGISEGSYSVCKDSKCSWKITFKIPTQRACNISLYSKCGQESPLQHVAS